MLKSGSKRMLLWSMLGVTVAVNGAESPYLDAPAINNPNVEEYVWKEGKGALPPYPKDENLQFFPVDQQRRRLSYYIDGASLVFGEDAVVRYTLVVRSKTGGQSVMFEGLRCQTKEYKAYAFGNGRGAFRIPRKSVWREVDRYSHNLFRYTLMNDYLCNIKILNPTSKKILDEMRYKSRSMGEDRT